MRTLLALALLVAAVGSGCLGEPEEAGTPVPSAYTDVQMVVESAEDEQGRVVVTADVVNTGDRTMYYRYGCAPDEPALVFTLITPEGVPVRFDPAELGCPGSGPAPLGPGGNVTGRFVFDGSLDGPAAEAPSGTYLAFASMHYWEDPVDIDEANAATTWRLYDSTRFTWQGNGAASPVALDLRVVPEAEAGDDLRVVGTATNTGASSVWYRSDCPTPLAVDTYLDGERVDSTWGPEGECRSNATAELAPGASVTVPYDATVQGAPGDAMTFVLRLQYWPTAEADGVPHAVGTGELVRVR